MPPNLLRRAVGSLSPRAFRQAETSQLLHSIQASPGIKFDGSEGGRASKPTVDYGRDTAGDAEGTATWAHRAGVNAITIDRFEGRYMLSGGSDSSIYVWDLDNVDNDGYKPIAKAKRTTLSHRFGITHLSFYPFDSLAFLSSSYDHTLKICATETLAESASFDLDSVIYNYTLSTIADHLLVACATQHPAVRLVDLRSGASAHSLVGHQGEVLSVSWSPKDEHILASGGIDGTARLWDIRRSAGSLGVLDMDDAIGIGGDDGFGKNARPRNSGKAHAGPCNGVVWKDDGRFLVTAGHDERVRVWDVSVGADALSHFGPIIKNSHLSPLLPLLVPGDTGNAHENVMVYPNEKEILMFNLFEGTLLKRLRVSSAAVAQFRRSSGQRNIKMRVTSMAWRAGDVEFYSAHSDGSIKAWRPKTKAEAELDREAVLSINEGEDNERKRKRQALDDMFRDLTRQKITFT